VSRVLVVDDRPDDCHALVDLLRRGGHSVHEAFDIRGALSVLRCCACEVVVAVVRVQSDGPALLCHIKADAPDVEVILFTSFGPVDDGGNVMKLGAFDCLPLPDDPDRVLQIVSDAAERHRLLRRLPRTPGRNGGVDSDIVAVDPKTRALFAKAAQVADADSTVLITGESGTGKEIVARAIHRQGGRRQAPFVPINCGAIPETLIESELFGHRRGSFTGAFADRKGLIEEAERGIVFLDEIGEMSPQMQVRLLRFVDCGEIRRVGDTQIRRVDVRVIAATNRTLEQEIALGRFRRDLFYRLGVILLHVPPLRERRGDIAELAYRHLHRTAARLKKFIRTFSDEAMAILEEYSWPGNVRELHNVVESAAIMASGDAVTEMDLPTLAVFPEPSIHAGERLDDEGERRYLIAMLERFSGNHTEAAAALGMSRTTLWRRLRRLGVEP
jgi:two-component system NtrC family response regulator